ncbi:MAG: phosphoribosylglycinamide formyltransferase [Gammaproteobacteria bacterium]|nr:MAG: phosphoribosylglycinamide formyltransferase [Gammaproteobacteria bacterium]
MSTPARVAVLISGSGTNLQAILDAAAAGELPVTICGVLSDRPDAAGLERARRAGVPAIAVDYREHPDRAAAEAALGQQLDALAPDIVVLAGFMRILPDELVERYAGRMLNVHPSLLPKFRGLDTFRRVLEAGDAWHGSTVHFVVPELDAGPRIIRYRIAVRPGDTAASLKQRVQAGEYRIYPRAIRWLAEGRLALRDGAAWLDGRRLDEPVTVDEAA